MAGCGLISSTAGVATTSATATTGALASQGSSAAPTLGASASAACSPTSLQTKKAGRLTVATGSPASQPWFYANNPANGKGFESAVAYAVAKELGYTSAQVSWVHASFDSVIAATPKSFDFDIDEVSITQARKKAVDFTGAYYDLAQSVIALKSDKYAGATSLDALHGARIGAHVGTSSVDAITNQIKPATPARTYPTNDLAVQALKSGQIDALVVDLATGFSLTSTELSGAKIIGQLPVFGTPQTFGLVLTKGSALTSCVSQALAALDNSGELANLQNRWLTASAGAPVLH